jgi:hypothetical protein
MAHVAVRKMIASYRVLGTALVPWLPYAALTGMIITALSGTALAYRPFDGTDAAVAKPREMEVELAPADLVSIHNRPWSAGSPSPISGAAGWHPVDEIWAGVTFALPMMFSSTSRSR